MICSEVMNKHVECLDQTESVQTAARRMRDKNVGFIPICDDSKRIVGTVTDRDIALRVLADGRPASTPLRDVMSKDVVSCQPNDDLKRAEELMGKRQKSRILVMDGGGQAVGVISLSDIASKDAQGAIQTMRQITSREAHP